MNELIAALERAYTSRSISDYPVDQRDAALIRAHIDSLRAGGEPPATTGPIQVFPWKIEHGGRIEERAILAQIDALTAERDRLLSFAADEIADAIADERAAVVWWLQNQSTGEMSEWAGARDSALQSAAWAIEAGDHVSKTGD